MLTALALRSILDEVIRQELDLPEGCSVTYELESIKILENLLRPARPEAALETFYRDFLERHGVRPTAVEAFHEGFNPRAESIEKTEITRSYKIVLLLAMISADKIPGEIGIHELVVQVAKLAARCLKVREDFSVDLDDSKSLRRLLVENPIRAFVGGQGTGEVSYFRFKGDRLSTTFEAGDAGSFKELLREILDWRLAQYLSRQGPGDPTGDIVCRWLGPAIARSCSFRVPLRLFTWN